MVTTISVAPREIHDLVYRAVRIAGCDPGTAERVAESVMVAEVWHGSAISALCDARTSVDLTASVWATAPDELLGAEIDLRAGGGGTAAFDPGVPLAALAGTLWHCLTRGVLVDGIDYEARGDCTVRVVELREARGEAAELMARFAAAVRVAHRDGVEVDRSSFEQLERAARGFLVTESTLDALSESS